MVAAGLVVPSSAFAFGTMAYNYGFDYTVAPYNASYGNLSYIPGNVAAYQYDHGYSARAYTTCWASAFQRNLGSSALGSMCIFTHGGAGNVILVSTEPASNGEQVSVFASNFVYPLDTGWVQVGGSTVKAGIAESRRAIDIADMSATRLVLYQACFTGKDPVYTGAEIPSTGLKNLLYSTAAPRDDWAKGAEAAIGFQGALKTAAQSDEDGAMDYWACRVFYYLTGGWNVRDSLANATNDVDNHTVFGATGYDTNYYRGNGYVTY